MILTQIVTQMNKMNVSIENAINVRQTQKYISPADTSHPLIPAKSKMIINDITQDKSSEIIRYIINPGKAFLITQQKIDNPQQQIEDGAIYCKVQERKK